MQTMRHAAPAASCASIQRRALIVRAQVASSSTKDGKEAKLPRPQNVKGDFWVDHTCIDCDTCRWMAPTSFVRVDGQSAVTRQPEGHAERVRALQALISCPTFSIHADSRTKEELQEAQQGLPAPIPGVPNAYHCGWHHKDSYAACSYLLTRPGGNVMVDSPRYNPVLARQIEALGGVRYIFLTHKDDVSDHAKWAKHFPNAVRIIHKEEVRPSTKDVEIQLEGQGPWPWSDITNHPASQAAVGSGAAAVDQGQDMELVFTPGHSSHHVCLYHAPTQTLFSGDHLASPEENGMSDRLTVFKDFCWYNFDVQLDSVAALLQYDWLHVLPGHGRQAHLRDATHRLQAVTTLLQQYGWAGVPATAAAVHATA